MAARRTGGGDQSVRIRPHAFKVLAPEPLVGGLLGSRGGAGILKEEIQNDTGARLTLSSRDDHYPKSRLRIIVVHAEEPQQVMQALDRLLDKTVECSHSERDTARAEPEFAGRGPGEIVFRVAVPRVMSEALIGPSGACLGQLRHETGVEALPDREAFDGHIMLRLFGPPGTVRMALERLMMVIDRSHGQEAFLSWAGVRQFPNNLHAEVDPFAASAVEASSHWDGRGYGGPGGFPGHGFGGGGPDGFPGHGCGGGCGPDGYWPPDHGGAEGRGGGRGPLPPMPPPPRGGSQGGGGGGGAGTAARGGGPPSGSWRMHPIFEALAAIADDFVEGGLDNDFSVSCDLPDKRCGALIGKRGEYVDFVERTTGSRVKFEGNESRERSDGMRTMSVVGKLMPVYAAHMLMMKRYLDTEAHDGFVAEGSDRLRIRLEELQAFGPRVGAGGAPGGGRRSPPRDERVAPAPQPGSKEAEEAWYDVEALRRLRRRAEDAGYLDLDRSGNHRQGNRSHGGGGADRRRSHSGGGHHRSHSQRDRRCSGSRRRSRSRDRHHPEARARSVLPPTRLPAAGGSKGGGSGKGDGAAAPSHGHNDAGKIAGMPTGGAVGDGGLPEPTFTVEAEAGRQRCVLTVWLPPRNQGQEPRSFQMRGPKRDNAEVAYTDGERMIQAFREGGESEARRVQRALQTDGHEAAAAPQPVASSFREEPEPPEEAGEPCEVEDEERMEEEDGSSVQFQREPSSPGFLEALLGPRPPRRSQEDEFLVRTWGEGIPGPIADWDEAVHLGCLAPAVRRGLGALGYSVPSLTQRYVMPVIAARRHDLVVEASAGAGKTLAFVLPLVSRLVAGPSVERPHCPGPSAQAAPVVLLLAATRELAVQTGATIREVIQTCQADVSLLVLHGGEALSVQTRPIERTQVDVVCSTPGRLIDVLDTGKISLMFVSAVVLDEADQLLNAQQGLDVAVGEALIGRDLPMEGRQTLLFSATFPAQLAGTVRGWLRAPSDIAAVQIGHHTESGGDAGGSVEAVEQYLVWVQSDQERWGRIGQDLAGLLSQCDPARRRAIVFANRIIQATALFNLLKKPPYSLRCEHIHGKLTQDMREEAMRTFGSGEAEVLVATNVAGRGLDFADVGAVLQADLPTSIEAYAHRIGRAGHGGTPGRALAYVGAKDTPFAPALLDFLRLHGQEVPPWLQDLASGAPATGP